jgi:hypothetical protein
MKKWIGLIAVAALLAAGCNDTGRDSGSSGSGSMPSLQGVWDFVLAPAAGSAKSYTITVDTGGGSNDARVLITGPQTSLLATVAAGNQINVGACGVWIKFGLIAEGITLVAGDSWTLTVTNGAPGTPVPTLGNASTVSSVSAGGTDGCATACANPDGSSQASTLPFPSQLGIPAGLAGSGQWYSVVLSQNGPSLTGAVPEEHVLSLNLGRSISPPFSALVSPGEIVTLSYSRRVNAGISAADFLRVILTNGADTPDVEYLVGPDFQAADTVQTVSYTFTVKSNLAAVDFIFGLAATGEEISLDDIKVTTASGTVRFNDGFESGATVACGPRDPRWSVRSSAWRIGSACVARGTPIAGSFSFRVTGGSQHRITASIINASSAGSLASLLGSAGMGLLGSTAGYSGILMEAWEPDVTYFLTSLALADSGLGSLAGTYKGEARTGPCIESGEVTATRHTAIQTDVSSQAWLIHLNGSANNCIPPLAAGNTVEFGDTLTVSGGETITVAQFGQVYFAGSPIPIRDNFNHGYTLTGAVAGALTTFSLAELSGAATATAVGAVSATQIQGALTGTLAFDNVSGHPRVCELASDARFQVTLVPP